MRNNTWSYSLGTETKDQEFEWKKQKILIPHHFHGKQPKKGKKKRKESLTGHIACRTVKRKLLKLWNVGERKESSQKGQREQGPKQRKQSGKKR